MRQQLRSLPEDNITVRSSQALYSTDQHRLDLTHAGPSSRILAYAIDYVVILLLQVALLSLAFLLFPLGDSLRSSVSGLGENGPTERWTIVFLGFLVVTQLLIEWVYFVSVEMTTRGRSLGKAIVKLRVVSDGGHPPSLGQSIARNLLRTVDILPGYYVVGLVSMVALDEGKRLGDLAAGTTVIRLDRPASQPILSSPPAAGAEVFRLDHQQIARLGLAEQRLARQTLRRLPQLPESQARLALERTVAAIVDRIGHDPVPVGQQEDFLQALLQAAQRR